MTNRSKLAAPKFFKNDVVICVQAMIDQGAGCRS